MLLRIACCDDEIENGKRLEDYIRQLEVQSDEEFEFDFYLSGNVLVEKIEKEIDYYDLILLDMEMPGMNGLELAKKIREIASQNVIISFLTSFPEYMQQSFGVQAFQYLLKPIAYEEFKREIFRTLDFIKKDEKRIMVVDCDKGAETVIQLKNVVVIEKMKGRAVMKITQENNVIYVKGNMTDYEQILEENHFIRVSRNCIVNMKYIHSFYEGKIEMLTGKCVEMSRRKSSVIKERFTRYLVLGGE